MHGVYSISHGCVCVTTCMDRRGNYLCFSHLCPRGEPVLRAGAAMIDITPRQFPVRVNGMVEEPHRNRGSRRIDVKSDRA